MAYFNYHAKLKNLIKENHMISFSSYDNYHGIKNCIVFFFDNHSPMPIREYRFKEYESFLNENHYHTLKNVDK